MCLSSALRRAFLELMGLFVFDFGLRVDLFIAILLICMVCRRAYSPLYIPPARRIDGNAVFQPGIHEAQIIRPLAQPGGCMPLPLGVAQFDDEC